MRKRIRISRPAFLAALLLTLTFSLHGQKYIVFSIKGEVKADGAPLKVQSVLSDDTKLTFSTEKDEIHVVSPTRGKMIITAQKAPKNSRNEFIAAVKEAILPPEEYRPTSTREVKSELIFTDVFDLKSFFRGNVLLIDTTEYAVKSESFAQDGSRRFVLECTAEERVRTAPLPGRGSIMPVSLHFLFSPREEKVPHEQSVQLFYDDTSKNKKMLIGTFTAVHCTTGDIVEELALLHKLIPDEPTTFFYEEALPFLERRYGKPYPQQVKKLLEAHLGLSF